MIWNEDKTTKKEARSEDGLVVALNSLEGKA